MLSWIYRDAGKRVWKIVYSIFHVFLLLLLLLLLWGDWKIAEKETERELWCVLGVSAAECSSFPVVGAGKGRGNHVKIEQKSE